MTSCCRSLRGSASGPSAHGVDDTGLSGGESDAAARGEQQQPLGRQLPRQQPQQPQPCCCFGELLSGAAAEGDAHGPVLAAIADERISIPRHGVVEVSTALEAGDAVAWALHAPGLRVACYWFDQTHGRASNQESDAFGVADLWPARRLPASQREPVVGSFVADCRATLVLLLDNRASNLLGKRARVTIEQRGTSVGLTMKTRYGRGCITNWRAPSYEVDLGPMRAFIPHANVCPGGTSQVVRAPAWFRVQHIHKPYKHYPSLEAMGLNRVAGAFDWTAGSEKTLLGKLSEQERETLRNCFAGLEPSQLHDYHVHIVGSGQNGSGCYLTPKMTDPFRSPFGYVKLRAFMSASGITLENADATFERRLMALGANVGHVLCELTGSRTGSMCQGPSSCNKMVMLAFERVYTEQGEPDMDRTTLHIPNDHAFAFAGRHPKHCIPTCSVHPYRHDCEAELERAAARGVRIIKWLPNSMLIDPLSPLCDRFYAKVRELDMIILSHTGEEHSVSSAALNNEFGNPLRLRRALDAGCRIIAAHLATEGTACDLDVLTKGCLCAPRADNFDLLMRMLREERYKNLLFADFSAVVCLKRCKYLGTILDATDIHSRLVYGSDYPVPCLNFSIVLRQLQLYGFLDRKHFSLLRKVYRHNPLLFDLALKRLVRSKAGNKFPDCAFHEHPDLQVVGWRSPAAKMLERRHGVSHAAGARQEAAPLQGESELDPASDVGQDSAPTPARDARPELHTSSPPAPPASLATE
eukprot:CAMPEP_0202077476 /NCGR_PEP_ID=MMETSP0964-20121228/5402_1 /ASSEMBLY_ACC=CAM_ASM_000500 /TAXON_ID=4773 /ORGANISM="Schizochytrium aggregatum, Strain ATCC28209" /LENGTH=753 /DNA_ID=CAMNT_0048644755 /DNA_START=54 /DNA_END=2315 /DNA_ORIENTATION=+